MYFAYIRDVTSCQGRNEYSLSILKFHFTKKLHFIRNNFSLCKLEVKQIFIYFIRIYSVHVAKGNNLLLYWITELRLIVFRLLLGSENVTILMASGTRGKSTVFIIDLFSVLVKIDWFPEPIRRFLMWNVWFTTNLLH